MNTLSHILLLESPVVPCWCNYCQQEKRSSLTVNGTFVMIEPSTQIIGNTQITDPFTKQPRTFHCVNASAVHKHKD